MKLKLRDKVKVIDQAITGTVLRQAIGNKWVILDDDPSQDLEKGDEPTLVFREDELELLACDKD